MPTERLSSLDASFLGVETPTAHMHLGWAALFDPPEEAPRPGFERLRDHIGRRLTRAPRCRQKVRSLPFGVNAPVWVDDADFDISDHVYEAGARRLSDVVDECFSEPLPRDRPLWQLQVATRLDDGRIGIVGKAHHCMVDGIAAVELASLLLDPSPEAEDPAPTDWQPARPPSDARLLTEGARDFVRTELGLASLAARALSSPRRIRGATESARRAAGALLDAVRPAPSVPALNEPISPARHLGVFGRPLEDMLRIRQAFGVKLNDVVLAASASGVRRLLRDRGEDPVCVKTMVPVNVRGDEEEGDLGNRISFMFLDLPCDEPDPVRRLRDIHLATSRLKEAREAEGAETVIRSLDFAPSPVQRLVGRLVSSPRAFNLVVSNIPGPRPPMYMRGCRLFEAYPVVPIADGHALSIGFTTVQDRACFGLYADPRSLRDVDDLAHEVDAAIDELLEQSDDPALVPALVGAG
jgi:diacylglycerol O-acyltransferase / wax synthase